MSEYVRLHVTLPVKVRVMRSVKIYVAHWHHSVRMLQTNSGVTRSKMILLHFVWRKSRCSMTEEWFPVGSSLQQLIDASYSRAIFWLVTWIPQFYSFLFIEPRTGDIGIMGPYLEWLVVISSMGRSENSRPQKTWLIMCFCIIICIEHFIVNLPCYVSKWMYGWIWK